MSYRLRNVTLAILLSVLAGCSPAGRRAEMIRIKGSDTMIILMSALAEKFMEQQSGVRLSVTGGGTRSGIAGMINGTCDLVAASRDITDQEIALAMDKGVTPKRFVIAKDAIAVIVNRANPIRSVTLFNLRMIFSGRVKNWRELGGKEDEPIIVYSRESSSGTFRYVQSVLLDNEDFSPMARFLPSNKSILDSVSQEPAAIGYLSYGHARNSKKIKCLQLKTADNKLVELSPGNILSGNYPLSREILLYSVCVRFYPWWRARSQHDFLRKLTS